MTVARDAAKMFTILFPIKIAISILSGLSLSWWSALAQLLFSLRNAEVLCGGTAINAVSLEEKNPESTNKIRNHTNDRGSISYQKYKNLI